MNAQAEDLIQGYLDHTLTDDQHAELSALIQADPGIARRFAEESLLHDRLQTVALLDEADHETCGHSSGPVVEASRRRIFTGLATAACVVLAVGWALWSLLDNRVVAASAELQRIIQASAASQSRTYRITILDDEVPEQVATGRGGQKPTIDGALLYVRGRDEYVLERFFADGTRFITGSDGRTAWAVPPRGRVRTSRDPMRFRGALPGQQHAFPFIEIRKHLLDLAETYDVELVPADQANPTRRLDAVRRAEVSRGPKMVTIWYDAASGEIQRMQMRRLPQSQGGPRSVELSLVSTDSLEDEFFQHHTHHGSERPIVEDKQ